jgi:hypothetical protein
MTKKTEVSCPINLRQCESYCNDKQIYPAMKYLVQEKKMSENAAGKQVERITEGKVTSNRARKVYRIRTPKPDKAGRTANSDKTSEKETKPETKIQLGDIQEAIANDEIADVDLKPVLDVISQKIAMDKISTKVSSNVAAVHKDKVGRARPSPAKPKKSLVEKVTNSFLFVATHLDAVLGKGPKALSAKDERMLNSEVRRALPYFLRTLLHMGVDLDNVLKEALKDYRKEIGDGKNRENYRRLEA